mgnify:CR=1 FL=1
MKKTALVLQGGGALGAYQYGAIKGLYEQEQDFTPSIITGVSIGAINGAVMLGGKYGPIKSLEKLWNAIKMPAFPLIPQGWQAKAAKFGNPNMYYINPNLMFSPLTADSVYDITPFQKLLENLIDFEQLNAHPTKLVIEVVNVETGQLERFSNQDAEGLSVPKLIASISIPPNFPAVKVNGEYYWDGGLYANMPLRPAVNHLRALGGELPDDLIEREVIVISLFRKNSAVPTTIPQITERIKEIIFESKFDLDQQLFEKMNEYVDLIREVDQALDKNSKVRQNKVYQQLLNEKKINTPILLQYVAEGVEGTDDFTPEAMDFRVQQGYFDMIEACKNRLQLKNAG